MKSFRQISAFCGVVAFASLTTVSANAAAVNFGTLNTFAGPSDPNLDLAGPFVYAVNIGGAAGEVHPVNSSATFTSDVDTAGFAVTAFTQADNWGARPNYDAGTTSADQLEEVMWDIKYNSGVTMTATVVPGQQYALQVLFSENYYGASGHRLFNIDIAGDAAHVGTARAVGLFDPNAAMGDTPAGSNPVRNPAATVGAVYALNFTASGSSLVISLPSEPNVDTNSIVNAVTLKAVPEPGSLGLLSIGLVSFMTRRRAACRR